jgi:hypothetical protein
MFVVNVKADNTVEVNDLWSTGESLPSIDTVNDYTIIS